MKKILSVLTAVLLSLSLIGCGNVDEASLGEAFISETVSEKTESFTASATTFTKEASVTSMIERPMETTTITSEAVTDVVTTAEEVQTTGHIHSFGEWATISKPSCVSGGEQERSCADCGKKETRTIDAEGHKWSSWKTTKEATTERSGERTRTCSVCGNTETQATAKLEDTKPTDSKKLLEILKNNNYTLEDINGSSQCIAVVSSGASCKVYLFEKSGGIWKDAGTSSGIVGKNGVSAQSREGDYKTPKGIFGLGFAFGTQNISDLDIPYRKVNERCYWVDDPSSEYYNQWVETDKPEWDSAEHLIDYQSSYKYAVVINYNMDPVVPGAGSAIFLHCMTGSYTAGCVAVPQADMLKILYWLRSDAAPVILIS